jgi:hypothetical protein
MKRDFTFDVKPFCDHHRPVFTFAMNQDLGSLDLSQHTTKERAK